MWSGFIAIADIVVNLVQTSGQTVPFIMHERCISLQGLHIQPGKQQIMYIY